MGVLTKKRSGLIFRDGFDLGTIDPMWDIKPYDLSRLVLSNGGLTLKHGVEPIIMSLPAISTEQEIIMDVRNTYDPVNEFDKGGIFVKGEDDENIVLEEYYDTATNTSNTYPYLRLTRDHNKYSGYWSEDGSKWHLIGSSYFGNELPEIGIYLEGDIGSDYILEGVTISKGRYLTIEGVREGTEVKLLNEVGTEIKVTRCIKYRDYVKFNVSDLHLPFKGTIEVKLPNESTSHSSQQLEIWGGDIYEFNLLPDVEFEYHDPIKGTTEYLKIEPNIEKFLGYFGSTSGDIAYVKMKLVNPFQGVTFGQTKLSIEEYLTDYHLNSVFLANDVGGVAGQFEKEITIPEMLPDEEHHFWVEMSRDEIDILKSNKLTFKIVMVTSYV